MSRRRVVVTGMGVISPVGNTVDEAWRNAVEGNSGIVPLTDFDTSTDIESSHFTTRIGGLIRNFDAADYVPAKEARKIDVFMHYGIAACTDAIRDAGLEINEQNAARIGIAMGSGIGGIQTIENNFVRYAAGRKISPFFVPGSIINMVSGHVSMLFGITGPNLALVTACSTATHSIGIAARTVAYGDAEVMLAGGAEHATTPLAVGGFCSARAMSTRNDDPEGASRPWDRGRDGFVLSDGAACLTVEELEHAKARGAHIYAELVGFGMSGDAFHITAPPADGAGAALCMSNALRDAGMAAEDIQYVNAHGTSTPVGDVAESVAIKTVFASHAKTLPVSSTKSTTGHLLGAAGGIEAIFSILALRDQVAPPTINYQTPDPECDLDYVPNEARQVPLKAVLSNSFGFGGTNGSLIFRTLD